MAEIVNSGLIKMGLAIQDNSGDITGPSPDKTATNIPINNAPNIGRQNRPTGLKIVGIGNATILAPAMTGTSCSQCIKYRAKSRETPATIAITTSVGNFSITQLTTPDSPKKKMTKPATKKAPTAWLNDI